MTPDILNAASWFVPWDRLSDAASWLVVAFGMILWATLVFSLFCLGRRTLFTGRREGKKHKRGQ